MTILLYNNGDTFFASNYTYTAGKKIIAKVIASGKKGKRKRNNKQEHQRQLTCFRKFPREKREARERRRKAADPLVVLCMDMAPVF